MTNTSEPRELNAIFFSNDEDDVIVGEIHQQKISGVDYVKLVEKSAFDRVVEALKFYADKNNHTVRHGGESDTRIRLDKGSTAREALKEVGEL